MAQQAASTASTPSARASKSTEYGFIAFALLLGLFIWWVRSDPNPPPTRPQPEMVKGAVIDAPITLVTADRNELACMWATKATDEGGYHCEFVAQDKPWAEGPTDKIDRKKVMAPYKTIDDLLILIPGLFEEPAVLERYNDEPPKMPKDKLQRFTAQCKVKLLTEAEGVMVRWNPKGQWQGPHKVWIGEASNCQVSEP